MSVTTLKPLTRYNPGSFGELATIALPLILAAISTALMLFIDRLILANYSIDAVNAVATAGTAFAIFQFGMICVTGISEVFVGQYNGSKQYEKIAEPVWQMIWFSLLCGLALIPLAYLGSEYLLPANYHQQALPYFRWLMYFAPLFPIYVALSGFYVGRGKTKFVLITTVCVNLLNALLDIILVFGVSDMIQPLGTEGAALATVIAQAGGVVVLGMGFLSAHSRKNYGASQFQLKPKSMMQCMRIGVPTSIGVMLEISAWACIFQMVALISEEHITLFAIGQSICMLLFFLGEGIHKAVVTVAANYIGANRYDLVKKTMISTLKLIAILATALLILLLGFSDELVHSFFYFNNNAQDFSQLYDALNAIIPWIWAIIVFHTLLWAFAGVLIAAGDTKFVMYMSGVNGWLLAVLPLYIFFFYLEGSAQGGWRLTSIYAFLGMTFFYLRYNRGGWKSIQIIESSVRSEP